MYRFAFDLGSGSLGWAVYRLDGNGHICGLVKLGSRIFPTGRDPQSKESAAAGRRQPRQQRRQTDRRIDRRTRLAEHLVGFRLMPPSERDGFFSIDPYEARARAAAGPADLYDLGRAIWHMSKHRGFKSNRKADRSNEDESGKIASASATLRQNLRDEGFATYGAWLASRHAKKQLVRVRPQATGSETAYEFYPQRAMLEEEFDFIWGKQAQHHSTLTDAARAAIRDAVFFQRPLKPVKPGRCTFFPEEERLPKWHPLAQEFLILQQLNMLRLLDGQSEGRLDLTARDLLARHLMSGEKLTWSGLRSQLKLPRSTEINLETGGLKELASNQVAARFAGTAKKPGPLADRWRGMGDETRLRLLTILDEEASPERAIERLVAEIPLPRDTAERIEKIPLPDGHLMLGERATRAIVQMFRHEVIVYSDAVIRASEAGLFGEGIERHHSNLRGHGNGLDLLPPYNRLPELQRMIGTGTNDPNDPDDIRYGRIANPTVHIALNQFRRVMNALIGEFGKPAQVVLETTRDMAKSARELIEIDSEIRKNTKRNDRWRVELEEAGLLAEGAKAGDRLLRMRLWEELGRTPTDRLCPYSGEPIPLHKLHSDEVEIDHILPFEDTFEDSPGNKTLCYRKANRIKGKRGPGDAWSGAELDAILARVKAAPGMRHKLWRFLPGALEEWQNRRGFEDRQLHATGHLAKVVRAYAVALFPHDGTSNVWVLPGRMTAMLRRRWGLYLPDHNAKTRDDHRHHALDAATVGAIDRRMIQTLQTYARRMGAQELDRLLPDAPEPYAGFAEEVRQRIASVIVSHRPDHSPSGKLHEDSAYGLVRDVPENHAARTIGNLVKRKPVVDMKPGEIGRIRDEKIRTELEEATRHLWKDERALKAALSEWSTKAGHSRLRILVRDESARQIHARAGKPRAGEPYKWMIPAENLFLDILEGPDGKWFRYGIDLWSKASGTDVPWNEVHPDARLIMRLYKGDTIQLFDWDDKEKHIIPETNQIKIIVSIPNSETNNYVTLAGVNAVGNLAARHNDPADDFRWDWARFDRLRLRRARRVRIDELGRVRAVPHGTI
ncbi:type II CRISPR RNA-guided endonuclease Cas9 [Paracoccus pacificus]|uniref:CRISPR-associated endonuclease Cas9 n=1 Tax=Paracoccus pacificus TaxID=1463598 RepID=A0ABW4R4I6_9RHOB